MKKWLLIISATVICVAAAFLYFFSLTPKGDTITSRESILNTAISKGNEWTIAKELELGGYIVSGAYSADNKSTLAIFEPTGNGDYKFSTSTNRNSDEIIVGGVAINGEWYDLIWFNGAKTEYAEIMEEVLIDDNMVFDIDNLKGFLNDTSSFGFIAKENNKIIGFAYCYTLLRPDGKTMFYLHSIGMLPNYQDKGYGSKLLSFIKEYSKEIGCSEMFLITDKGNPRACHVYEKLGGKNDYKDEIVYVYDYEKGDK